MAFSETNAAQPQPEQAQNAGIWEKWKQDLGGIRADFIDALVNYGELNAQQLRIRMKCSNQSVYNTANALTKLGLIRKNGSKYALKES